MKIQISESAKKEMDKTIEASGKKYLRLAAGARTCCDIIFTIRASDKFDNDAIYTVDNYNIIIEEDLDGIYENFIIDYSNEGIFTGFNVKVF